MNKNGSHASTAQTYRYNSKQAAIQITLAVFGLAAAFVLAMNLSDRLPIKTAELIIAGLAIPFCLPTFSRLPEFIMFEIAVSDGVIAFQLPGFPSVRRIKASWREVERVHETKSFLVIKVGDKQIVLTKRVGFDELIDIIKSRTREAVNLTLV